MNDPATAELLKKQRAAFKGQLTQFKQKITASNSIGEVGSLLRRIQVIYNKYDAVQSKLEDLDDTTIMDRTAFEDEYGTLETTLRNKLYEIKKTEDSTLSTSFLNTSHHDVSNNGTMSAGIRLPEITLPTFNGREAEWLAFRDIFVDLIHSKNLEPTIKFLYLTSSIRIGSAFRIIESLPVTATKYELAWKSLCERYDNEINIQKLHMRELYDVRSPAEHSAKSLEEFLDKIVKHYNALRSLKVNVRAWDLMLIHHLTQKLDNASQIFIVKGSKLSSLLSFTEFVQLLRTRVRVLQAMPPRSTPAQTRNQRERRGVVLNTSLVVPPTMYSDACIFCHGPHKLPDCPEFNNDKLSPKMRFNFVKDRRFCGNCLLDRHLISECNQPPCKKCQLKHHSLLHFSTDIVSTFKPSPSISNPCVSQSQTPQIQRSDDPQQGTSCSASILTSNSSIRPTLTAKPVVLIGTAVVKASTTEGTQTYCRALLDSGSTLNFVTANACSLLNAKKTATSKNIAGIGGSQTLVKYKTYITISSRVSSFSVNLKFYVIPKITTNVPSVEVIVPLSSLPTDQLADPQFNIPGRVDLLLGADIYHQLFTGSSTHFHEHLPPFQQSELGYFVCGKSKGTSPITRTPQEFVNLCSVQALDDSIRQFWELETLPSMPLWSEEATLCETHYQSNVTRLEDGRYCVALPTKPNIVSLGNSQLSAQRQFVALEKRLNGKPDTYVKYREFIDEYMSLGHMTPSNPITREPSYFLPHHCVFKEQSTTTKLRVVFNASSKTSSQLSLNDCLLVGPTIQSDLFSVLLRFRKHVVAFSGDITKMYRQIRIRDDQIDLQQIWWGSHTSDNLQAFNLRTVTYGTACAPFLATRTLKQLAMDECSRFPNAANTLQTDFYVDDVLTGAPTIENAHTLKSDLTNLWALGGFELRKFYSNKKQLASEDQLNSSTVLVLGLVWNTNSDCLETPFDKVSLTMTYTKRGILSEICRLFDPLGFCAPMTVTAKMLMQSIWMQQGIGWDDILPADITHKWKTFKTELSVLSQVTVPRIVIASVSLNIELHGFCDASERAYGCVLYVRVLNASHDYVVTLLCAKSRVTPLKKETIPRLELCAAVLLSEVVDKVLTVFGIKFDAIYYWTDSKITLFRIRSEAYKYATFVANRISKIQELSSFENWHYVRTKENPADIVSRGLMPSQFISTSIWWTGPDFLQTPSTHWPSETSQNWPQDELHLELRKSSEPILVQNIQDDHIFHQFSSVTRLYRVVAYIYRFFDNAKHTSARQTFTSIQLQPSEIRRANLTLVKLVQEQYFSDDMRYLSKHKCLPPKSSLLSLAPFLDNQGILRVGGRIKNAETSNDHKHPILLPQHHVLSSMIARAEHLRLLHAGTQALLYSLRLSYWIVGARGLCRNIVHRCVTCFRSRPQIRHQIMGNLPEDRVKRVDRAFSIVGVDFCGPFQLSQSIRSKIKVKCYICVFVCFTTKAVHLELVHSLSTEAFIACFRRFIARRGICHKIYSDNATNFVGARSELKDPKRLFFSQSFQLGTREFCNTHNIEWLTIPPRSPHFGGLWEAAIRSSKTILVRVIGTASFSIEEFLTLTTQIEACLNSRPLTPISSDPSDLMALTPGHFLIGTPLTTISEPSLIDLNTNRLSRFQKIQKLLQEFWTRWHVEYLSELQKRRKWNRQAFPIRIGDLALLHEDNVPPMKWLMGRITAVYPGTDGVIRVVSLKTAHNELKRAVSRISILPNTDNEM